MKNKTYNTTIFISESIESNLLLSTKVYSESKKQIA